MKVWATAASLCAQAHGLLFFLLSGLRETPPTIDKCSRQYKKMFPFCAPNALNGFPNGTLGRGGAQRRPKDLKNVIVAHTTLLIGVRGFRARGYFIPACHGTRARWLGKNPCRCRATARPWPGPGLGLGPSQSPGPARSLAQALARALARALAWALARALARPGPLPGPDPDPGGQAPWPGPWPGP